MDYQLVVDNKLLYYKWMQLIAFEPVIPCHPHKGVLDASFEANEGRQEITFFIWNDD